MQILQAGALANLAVMAVHPSESIDFNFGNQLNQINSSYCDNPCNHGRTHPSTRARDFHRPPGEDGKLVICQLPVSGNTQKLLP